MKHEPRNTLQSGSSLKEAEKIIILIHGRGASAESILTLAQEFRPDETACYLAPAATGHAWYPYSFMAPRSQNEPWLSSALDMLDALVKQCLEAGKSAGQIVLAGFSQGACLATEFASRRAARYGGVIGFSGGLIGREIARENYSGDFKGTPVFLGCSDVDFHIPEARVHETAALMERLGAAVETQIYPGMPHTINQDELLRAQKILDKAGN